ncbi:MAG: HEPN domain-containing protein [Nanoarchaeota archaeon]
MSHAKNKLDWCLKKAEKELSVSDKHRGLVQIKPDLEQSKGHIIKAEHYLKAADYLKRGGFSDLSASALFYVMYHSLLAIATKLGYESRNQECTFALISSLIEENKIDFPQELLKKIFSFDELQHQENTCLMIRELYQYGTSLSLSDNIYNEMFNLAKEVISKTKIIMEQ